jgi:hypothetical protein
MGFYARVTKSTVVLPFVHTPTIVARWKALKNTRPAFMPTNYDATAHSAQEILTLLGFEHETQPTGDIKVLDFDNKSGSEEDFFKAIEDLVPAGAMNWVSDGHERWTWVFNGQTMSVV